MRKRILTFGVFIFTIASTAARSDPNEIHDSRSQCGISALRQCMCYLGIQVTLERLYSAIPPNENNEVNLYQLAQYARSCGVHTKPIKCPTLSPVKTHLTSASCAILQFKYPNGKRHIVALFRPQNRDICVFDISLGKSIVSDGALRLLLERSQGMLILSLTRFQKSIFGQMNRSGGICAVLAISALGVLIATTLSIRRDKCKTL